MGLVDSLIVGRRLTKGLSGNKRPIRHCEQSEAIQTWAAHLRLSLDCFAVARNDGIVDFFIPDDSESSQQRIVSV